MKIEKRVKVVGKDLCGNPIYCDFPMPSLPKGLPKGIAVTAYALGCANTTYGQHLNISDISITEYKRYIKD